MGKTFGIDLRFVAKGDWTKRQDRFTRFIHGVDIFLEAARGSGGPELTVGVDENSCAARRSYPIYPGDKSRRMRSYCTDADCGALGGNASVANIDIVAAGGEILTREHAQGDVVATGVVVERLITVGRVGDAGGVVVERLITDRRIAAGSCIGIECFPFFLLFRRRRRYRRRWCCDRAHSHR